MTKQDLIEHEIGSVTELTDGIYTYILRTLCKGCDRFHHVIENTERTGGSFTIFEHVDKDGNVSLSFMATIGGLHMHTDTFQSFLSKLEFIK